MLATPVSISFIMMFFSIFREISFRRKLKYTFKQVKVFLKHENKQKYLQNGIQFLLKVGKFYL